jgi:hypothetical protein
LSGSNRGCVVLQKGRSWPVNRIPYVKFGAVNLRIPFAAPFFAMVIPSNWWYGGLKVIQGAASMFGTTRTRRKASSTEAEHHIARGGQTGRGPLTLPRIPRDRATQRYEYTRKP